MAAINNLAEMGVPGEDFAEIYVLIWLAFKYQGNTDASKEDAEKLLNT